MKQFLTLLLSLLSWVAFSQKGTVKGTVIDKLTEVPLPGATVTISTGSTPVITDEKGAFEFTNVPLGRLNLTASFAGYAPVTIPNVDVTAGKEVILTAALTETLTDLQEVVVKQQPGKVRALNKMAAVSARQFSTEEVNRYAGGRSDIARLVSNFAGVSTANDSRNDIVVRGNAPTGMLWRLEGIPIPSPNHFSTVGTTGSPVSALNPNMIANSDFITSAFPAEYGNALSGVFDLNLRKGNKETYEFLAGVGAYPGAELMAEGPFLKKEGSFLVAARYGIAGYLGGAGTGAAIPNYNDIAFNLDFGKGKAGEITFFGIVGFSDIEFLGKDADDSDLFSARDANQKVRSNFFVTGLTQKISLSSKTFLKSNVAFSGSANKYDEERIYFLDQPQEVTLPFTTNDNRDYRITVSSYVNSKLAKGVLLRSGVLLEHFSIDYSLRSRDRQSDADGDGFPDYNSIYKTKGDYNVVQPYAQLQWRLSDKLTLNGGLHGHYFSLTDEVKAEPRAAVTYNVTSGSSLSFGYGRHHQNVPAPIQFQNENVDGVLVQTNRNLRLVASDHYVLGFEQRLGNNWRAKAEVYYQSVTNAAVERDPTSYSSITEGADFGFSTDKVSLVNGGRGRNRGVEVTVEKFFSDGYHALLTGSFFDAKYKGSDGIWRNSPFNNQYVVNFLAGKELKMGKARKNTLSFDMKLTTSGGRFYTPVDLEASQAAGYEIKQDDIAFSEQYRPYFRLDLRTGFKFNSGKRKSTHLVYLELQNVTDHDNIFIARYNRLTNEVNEVNQIGFFPDFGYRFQF